MLANPKEARTSRVLRKLNLDRKQSVNDRTNTNLLNKNIPRSMIQHELPYKMD